MPMDLYRETLDQIEGDTPFGPAEQLLLDQAHSGRVRVSAKRPDTANDSNRIRAPLIRHILLGGCDRLRVTPKGVAVEGAYITGLLDLEGVETPLDLRLDDCTLDTIPDLMDARLGAVILPVCQLPGLSAHRLRVTRGVCGAMVLSARAL